MDDYLELICNNKEHLDTNARKRAYSYPEKHVKEALDYYTDEEAEIMDMLDQDFHRQLHTEETVMEYADGLFHIRRIIFYLNERLASKGEVDELTNVFQEMAT